MHNTVELNTKRLYLRKLKKADYKVIFDNWASNYEVSKYVTWTQHKSNIETKGFVDDWIKEYENEFTYRWIVIIKETDEIIGMIDVIDKNIQYMTVEVGFCYSPKYWGQGYASEALEKVIDFLHSEEFVTVYAQHFISNIASGKVMQKAGMVYEGTLKSRVIDKLGKREDVCIYSSVKTVTGKTYKSDKNN